MDKEYKVDPRLLTWIKNNMQGCPQTPGDLLRIKRLDRWKVTVTCDEREKETTFSVALRAGEEAPSL